MKKLWKVLFAAGLTAAALVSMPSKASAIDWCAQCAQYQTCYDCCRCDGGLNLYCTKNCP